MASSLIYLYAFTSSGFEVPSSTGSSGGEPANSSLKKSLGYGPDLTSEVRNSPSDCFDYQVPML